MTSKFDPERAKEAQQFVEDVTGEKFSGDFQESLKSGVLLCNMLNKIEPGTVPKIQTSNMPFKQMENIASYVQGSKKLGVPDEYNFVTVDLFEGKNLGQVVQNIIALKRARGHGFNKVVNKNEAPAQVDVMGTNDQTTDAKSQKNLISRDPKAMHNENELSRTGQGMVSGRHNNTAAMPCPICTKPITSGAVNAVGKAFHTQCFTCRKCDVKLSTSKYYEHEGWAYCDRCILVVKPQTAVKGATKDVKGFKF
eukprot:TRINITY_DN13011_c0_g1_i1.p1 TRINITY_DN13011_c0_g1~~TRINITY_DN13011_c0_g1_i1.p1  ORF type:complete len:252 (+),score=71.74 TRINITY_DN13011_c0_g1_i1:95-850(+)